MWSSHPPTAGEPHDGQKCVPRDERYVTWPQGKVNTLVQSELSSLVKSGSGSPRKLNNVWIEEYYNCFNLTSQSMTLKGCF